MNLYENPLMSLGLGLLAANQPGANLGQVLGRGGLLAMENMRLGQQHAANLAQAKAAEDERKRKEAERLAGIERGQNIAKLVSSPEYQAAGIGQRQAMMAQYMPEHIAKQTIETPKTTAAKAVKVYDPASKQTRYVSQQEAIDKGLLAPPPSPLVSQEIKGPEQKLRTIAQEAELATIKSDIEYYNTQRQGAQEDVELANRGLSLLKRGQTGAWKPAQATAAKWLGLDPELVESAEIWNDLSTELALDKLQSFKGPTTDFEYSVARNAVAQFGKTGFSNYVALTALKRAAQRAQRKPIAYSKWIKRTQQGMEDKDFEQWYADEYDQGKAFDLDQLKKEYNRRMGIKKPKGLQSAIERAKRQRGL